MGSTRPIFVSESFKFNSSGEFFKAMDFKNLFKNFIKGTMNVLSESFVPLGSKTSRVIHKKSFLSVVVDLTDG